MSRRHIAFVLAVLISATTSASGGQNPAPDLAIKIFYPAFRERLSYPGDSVNVSGEKISEGEEIDGGRVALVGGLLAGSIVGIHLYQQNGWWSDNRAPFHFQEDLVYGLWVDKVGHFYGATLLAFTIRKSLEWANVPGPSSLWLGSGAALLFQTYVEAEDGFSKWGFDRVDFAFDVGGAGWPVARHYFPVLRNFDLKLSYHSSPLLGSAGGTGFAGQKHLVIDDYEGQTFWLSIKFKNILPDPVRDVWPDFLRLAVGYGARGIAGSDPNPVLLLAPDLDMSELIPPGSSFLKTLGEALNFIHMPLPAVQVSPGAIWYGVYF